MKDCYWKTAVILSNCSLFITILITLGFWLVVFPMEEIKYSSSEKKEGAELWAAVIEKFVMCFTHVLPISLIIIDFCNCGLIVYWRHLPFFYSFGIIYVIINYFQTMSRGPLERPIYPTHDWINEPVIAILVSIAIALIFIGIFWIVNYIAQNKLIKHYI